MSPDADTTWPISPKAVENIRKLREDILALDERIGGWSTKSECRQKGLSVHFRFGNKVDVLDTTSVFLGLIQAAPGYLVNAIDRLLAAAAPDELDESERGKPHAQRCGALACPCYVEAQRKTIEAFRQHAEYAEHALAIEEAAAAVEEKIDG